MVIGKRLKSALARVVGQQIPVNDEVLVSDGALNEIVKIPEEDGILKEVPGLNQYDLTILLIRAGVDAGMARLRKNFADLYKQRNSIVHGSAARSSIEHNERLRSNAESMAQQAIVSEVDRWLKAFQARPNMLANALLKRPSAQ